MEDNMLLTIGMIVKNEEKYLDECLTALKPILKNIKSELIIVDTGSTDNTVEIAKKYTDKVLYFEWCNDFAAARNVTIDHAKGEWYMFVDADEILEDAREIIDFFKSKKYKKYMSAAYYIMNYSSVQKTSTSPVLIPRMRKMTDKTRFIGIVHEMIPFVMPVKNLTKTEFMHHGYALATPKQAKAKHKRNVELLLKQLDNVTDNSKLRKELGESYMLYDTPQNKINALKHFKKGKELAIKENSGMSYILSICLIMQYVSMQLYLDAIDEAELYFKSKSELLASDTDVYYSMLQSYISLNKYEDSINVYTKYVNNLHKYQDKSVVTREVYARALYSVNDLTFYKASLYAISAYIKLEKYDDACKLIKELLPLSCKFNDNQDLLFKSYLDCMKQYNDYNDLLSLYNTDIEKNKEYKENLEKAIEVFINENVEEKNKIISLISKLNEDDDSYINFMKIRQSYLDNAVITENMIIDFLNKIKKLELYHSDIIYFILRNNISPSILKSKLDISSLLSCFDLLNKNYDDFLDTISNYSYKSQNPYESYVLKSIFELSLIIVEDKSNEFILSIFNTYIQNFEAYLRYTYNKDVITDDNINLLPRDIQFGYYCIKANEALANNDELNYIKLLRKALDVNNSMKDLISLLTENVDINKDENETYKLSEFETLALTIKSSIKDLIKSNNFEDAKSILAEYKALNPTDIEITDLEKIIIN